VAHSPAPALTQPAPPPVPHRTAHPPPQRKELAGKMASKSHRQKVEAMNEYLSKIPEHNDIPKISYAGTG
jgi:hypothetical protein